jgi:transposase
VSKKSFLNSFLVVPYLFFFNKKHNQVKLLLWEGDGFDIYYKRLEKGTYELPTTTTNSPYVCVTHQQMQWIRQGIMLTSIRRRKRYHYLSQSCGYRSA